MTDLADGELNAEKAKLVSGHLAECHACREFKYNFIKTAVEPFKAVRREPPAAYIWRNIRSRIEQKNTLKDPILPDMLRGWLSFPRVALATATVALLIFVSVLFISNQRTGTNAPDKIHFYTENTAQTKEDYFSYLYEGIDESYENETGLGTAIEELIL